MTALAAPVGGLSAAPGADASDLGGSIMRAKRLSLPSMLTSACLALLLVVLCLGAMGGSGAVAPASAQAPGSACSIRLDKTAAPATINLGGSVTVTLKLDGTCPEGERPADVVLIIDRSSSMASNNKLTAAKQAATGFVDRIDPTIVHVGVVAIGPTPVRIQALTADRDALRAAIAGMTSTRGTNMVDALAMARDDLFGSDSRSGVAKVIVFLTDGKHSTGPDISDIFPILDALRQAAVEVYSIALGSDADTSLLQQIASSAAHYYFSPSAGELAAIYEQIAGRIKAAALIKTARIVDRVPGNMRYVTGSSRPSEPSVSADGRTLTWNLADVKEVGTSLTYELRPLQSGNWPTNVEASLIGSDGFDNAFSLLFPVPRITVNAPAPEMCVCSILYQPWRVGEADRKLILAQAKAAPQTFAGWNRLMNEGVPGSPPWPVPGFDRGPNPRRTCLDLQNRNVPYHPLFNSPVWRAVCLTSARYAGSADTLP